jgi:alkylation response protein AidB-like acyl-CoA dehydrogenase
MSEEQEILKTSARDFLQKECPKQLVRQLDESDKGYSPELWRKMAELGWMGLPFPEKYGGAGMDFVSLAIAIEEISRVCASTGVIVAVQNTLAEFPILEFG